MGLAFTFPFNHVRCLQQTQNTTSSSIFRTMRDVVASNKGIRGGLYRGLGTALTFAAPSVSLLYVAYFKSNDFFFRLSDNEHASTFAAGLTSNIFSALLWTPMENIVQRMWVKGKQASASTVARGIRERYGPLGFWRAYGSTLAVWSPLSASFFMMYEAIMLRVEQNSFFKHHERLGVAVASSTAASIAVVATNPMDIMRTRYQVSDGNRKLSQVAKAALEKDGVKLFSIGLRARLFTIVPDMTFGISIFEVPVGGVAFGFWFLVGFFFLFVLLLADPQLF